MGCDRAVHPRALDAGDRVRQSARTNLSAGFKAGWLPGRLHGGGRSLVAFSGISAIDLHRGAREWPSATLLTCALAGAFAFGRWRHARYAAAAFSLAAVVAGFLGTTTFLDRVANDPFLAHGGPLTVKTLTGAAIAEFEVALDVDNLWLSPAGGYFAVRTEDQNEELTIHAGRVGGALRAFIAEDALFVDEGRLLLLERPRRSSMLRVVDLETGNEVWSRSVPLSAAVCRSNVHRRRGACSAGPATERSPASWDASAPRR